MIKTSEGNETRLYAEHACESAEDFLRDLSPALGSLAVEHSFERQHWIFRGQGDAGWTLRPSACRPHALAALVPGQDELPFINARDSAERELDGFMRFAAAADRAGFALPGDAPTMRDSRCLPRPLDLLMFPPTEYLGLAALAQHYGLPTRLLDWTSRPYTAAYFAAWDCILSRGATRDRMAVWALSASFVGAVGGELDPGIHVVSAPAASNPNLHAQGGLFTLVQPRTDSTADGRLRDLDELIHDLDIKNVDLPTTRAPSTSDDDDDDARGLSLRSRWAPVLWKFTLPVTEVRTLVRLLADLGVSAATVYPGLAGVAQSMLEARHYQWGRTRTR